MNHLSENQQSFIQHGKHSLNHNVTLEARKEALRALSDSITTGSIIPTSLLNKLMAAWLKPKIDPKDKQVLIGIMERLDLPRDLDPKPIKRLLLYDSVYYQAAGDVLNKINPFYVDAFLQEGFTYLYLKPRIRLHRLLEIAHDFMTPFTYPVMVACWRSACGQHAIDICSLITDHMITRGLTIKQAMSAFFPMVAQVRFLGTPEEFYLYVACRLMQHCPLPKMDDLLDAIDMAGDYIVHEKVYDISPYTTFHDFKISTVPNYIELTMKALSRSVEAMHLSFFNDERQLQAELADLGVIPSENAPNSPIYTVADRYFDTLMTRLFYAIPSRLKKKAR